MTETEPSTSKEEFVGWWIDIHPKLLARARKLTATDDQASDLVQDVAVLALNKIKKFRFASATDFYRWAYLRLKWRFLDQIRAKKPTLTIEEAPLSTWSAKPIQERSLNAASTMQAALKCLPERQREVLLWMAEGLTTREIAEQLHIEPATVRSLLRHARNRLAELMHHDSRSED